MLRYADGTPFPYGQDFLDVLVDAVDACTAMFEAADELDREQQRSTDARRDRDAEDKRLAELEKAIAQTITAALPASPEKAPHSQRAAKKTLAGVKRTIEDSRAQLRKLYAVAAAGPRWEPTAMRIQDAAAAFFARRALPDTRWTWSWDADATRAEATMRSGMFSGEFDVALDPIFRAPVRIGVLLDGTPTPVLLPQRRLLGKPVVGELALDRLYLVRAARDAEAIRLVIRAHAHASPGWRVTIPIPGPTTALATTAATPSVVALDKKGRDVGLDYALDRDVIARLTTALESAMTAMLRNRQAREVRFDDVAISDIADTSAVAKNLLDTLAPTVRAIRAKSKVSGELSLKRDVTAGVREELFVPRAQIAARYANLSERYRNIIDATGIGHALTNSSQLIAAA
jgi:hypothetical protein